MIDLVSTEPGTADEMPSKKARLDIPLQIYTCSTRLSRCLNAQSGITPARIGVMLTLRELGRATVKELAQRESVSHSTMSRVVSALVTDGLLEQLKSATDGRETLVKLSKRGVSQLKVAVRDSLRPLQRAIKALPNSEASRLVHAVDLVEALVESLSQDLRHQKASR